MNKTIEIKNNNLSAKIETLGAQLISLKDEKNEYMWQRDENVWGVLFTCGFSCLWRLERRKIYF